MGLERERVEMLLKLHNVNQEQLDWLADTAESDRLASGYSIVDLCTGNGIAASTVIQGLSYKGITPGEVILVDNHMGILQKAIENLTSLASPSSILLDLSTEDLDLELNSIDIVVAKMGLHELPFARQSELLVQVHKYLKPGGQLIIWENNVDKINGADKFAFNEIIAEKDRLAGLTVMAKQRYFTSGDQLQELLVSAGFINVEVSHEWVRVWNSYDRLDTEFKGDINKLEQLNKTIDRLIPVELRVEVGFNITNAGLGRSFNLSTQIIKATK